MMITDVKEKKIWRISLGKQWESVEDLPSKIPIKIQEVTICCIVHIFLGMCVRNKVRYHKYRTQYKTSLGLSSSLVLISTTVVPSYNLCMCYIISFGNLNKNNNRAFRAKQH